MKSIIISVLLIILCVSGCHQKEFSDKFPEKVKKEKLNQVNLASEIIPGYPTTEYNNTINYVSIDILATCDGKSMTAMSKSDTLTAEQKNILSKVDPGTNVDINIKFTYKDPKNEGLGGNRKVKEMAFMVEVI